MDTSQNGRNNNSDVENQMVENLSRIDDFLNTDNNTKNNNNNNKKNEAGECCFYCCTITFLTSLVLGLVAAIICYYVFGIKFLARYYNKSVDCKSVIGDYVISSIVLMFILGGGQGKSNKGDNKEGAMCANLIFGIIWLVMGIYGIIETTNENCEEIRETKLWEFAYITSIIFLSLSGTSFLISFCVLPCIFFKNK